jgi:hypothetical protein
MKLAENDGADAFDLEPQSFEADGLDSLQAVEYASAIVASQHDGWRRVTVNRTRMGRD